MDESWDDDLLEPLPVYEDCGPVHPAPVAGYWRVAAGDLRPRADARPRSSATFTRLTTLNPTLLADLPNWWRGRARDARVRVGRRLLLEAPSLEPSGTWRLRGALRSPWLRRWIPVELQLWPRLGAWTKVSLEPQHHVRPGRLYFGNGHRVLDALTSRLTTELHPARLDGRGCAAPDVLRG